MKKINLTNENKQVIKKIIISVLVIGAIIFAVYLLLKHFGLTDLTREQIQNYIQSKGALGPIVFIGISFLQVTFIPLPGMVTILAGSYCFGMWESFLYSYIGMNLGGLLAFALGRIIGKPYVNWVAGGKEKAEEWIKKLKGREKVFLKDIVKKRELYVKDKDKQMLEAVISRVNGIYEGLSDEGQIIATALIKILMEDIANL